MSRVIVVSPHLDDAVFSTGDMLSREENAAIITIFAGVPKDGIVTPYDIKTGFETSKLAMEQRRREDIKATAHLGVEYIHLDFFDSQYEVESKDPSILKALRPYLESADILYAPVGLKHEDHIRARDIVVKWWIHENNRPLLYLYEELPYRVMDPLFTMQTLGEIENQYEITGVLITNDFLTVDKTFSVHKYNSQIGTGDINTYTVLVPERYWQIK